MLKTAKNNNIKNYIFQKLGKPPHLVLLDINQNSPHVYRVNVYVNNKGKTSISESFFITTDGDGTSEKIISCDPQITKRY